MSKELESDQKEFEGQLTIEMYKELLEESYSKVAGLKLSLKAAQVQTVTLRDNIAVRMLPTTMVVSTSLEDAAVDAYRAADALLRVRDHGTSYDSDVIDLLKRMRDTVNDDTVFGRQIRNFLKDK